ncbi:MAG: ubiquinone/menaquinone biosynthesis methyltransferase [Acidobacteria bacterium]|nr:ubiquinone/menaquinone biosynthesis methyltransferase [Acidobacteriota bacterium]
MAEKLNLIEHLNSKEKKQGYVTQMFEIISPKYDFITRFLSFGMDGGWKIQMMDMLKLQGHERVLDLACGTGDITFAEAERLPRGFAVGLDITSGMIKIANEKREQMGVNNVRFDLADIMQMPYENAEFEHVTAGYALRNVPDIPGALQEIKRVLKPGGRFFSLDFGHPPFKLYDWAYINYLIVTGSLTGLALHGDADVYRYIPESLKRYPGQRGVVELMQQAGFVDCGYKQFMGGIMAINWGTKPK